ncbi:DEAD-box ATP-dependent RNA helicase 6 isoform X2 [Vigna radiata var. radiata]|uniref:DEAD-box ATP-dependent RNA helicase 6 isoform X2 n=1 Tax=Vigna radiata var. radiata TaxID=3916 RepID=A0A3Q0ESG9_VIGRR|nr:DEAD-box ATP-dependent RNA helicase 6 isoform X2 [Vigna radiata var. radiata]
MSPVSFCTFLVVLLVYVLSLQSSSAANLLNAVVFVGLIALIAFPLVLLYYYNCTAFLRHYTRFSAFFVLASVGGSILLSLLQRFSTPVDSDVTVSKGNEFEDYFLKSELLMGIYEKGFERPSPIQKESIPIALTGSDILARAEKGPGKTAAFCIPALEKIDQDNNVIQGFAYVLIIAFVIYCNAVVILVPTPELALQTSQVCKELGKHLKIQVMVTTGGTSLTHDIIRLYQPVHLLIGTPGRILDLVKKDVCILKYCSMLVMDEADKLLSPEFQPSIEQLIPFLPRTRQIVMFSATFPVTVKDFKDRYLRKPNIINLMDELTLKVEEGRLDRPDQEAGRRPDGRVAKAIRSNGDLSTGRYGLSGRGVEKALKGFDEDVTEDIANQ